ncbi:2-phospho-L-lactate guanylyltransferase [Myxococcaceae bacterium]|nr:2-phospho-L-lactate guanylyltransferase [Myxococcaceae bacterium]
MIAALVPVKRLEQSKSRLRPGLAPDTLRELTLAMLADVVDALRAAPEIGTVAVVTEDPKVASAASSFGARPLLRSDEGLNASLDGAREVLSREGATALLVVLGDVPGLSATDVRAICEAGAALGPRGAVLVPARDGGTAALLRTPPDVLESRFGPESAARHRDEATRNGVPFRELASAALAIDLDRPEDVEAFLAGPGAGPRTRAVLGVRDRAARS